MKAVNIIEVTDFSQKEWRRLINDAVRWKQHPRRRRKRLKDRRVGLLFDANSLRTRLSFEAATHLLGGSTYTIDIETATHEKDGTPRETLEDIIDTLDTMIDVYVIRDYSCQLFEIIKRKSYPPFINGFCLTGHPSQALADLSVLQWKKGTLHGLNYVGVCSSQGSGIMESFVYGVLLLGERVTLITETGELHPKNADFYSRVEGLAAAHGGSLSVTAEIEPAVHAADVLYVDEWWEHSPTYLKRDIGKYKVDERFLRGSKPELSILHCLPAHPGREIDASVMRSDQSLIFEEAEFRVYSAMALLSFVAQ